MPDGFFTAEPLGKPVIVAFFKKKKKIKFWGTCCCVERGATLHFGAQASHCSGFPCRGAQALGVWTSSLQHTGSVAVVHGLSCSTECGIFLHQGLNTCALHWQVDSYPLHHQESLYSCILKPNMMMSAF